MNDDKPNGLHEPVSLRFGFATQPNGMHAMQINLGPLLFQTVMSLADADRICADWRKAIDEAKSPIQIVGGGLVKPR